MAECGKGEIINITAMVTYVGLPAASASGVSRAAVDLLTTAWAAAYDPWDVTVTASSPGPGRTEGTAAMGAAPDQLARLAPAEGDRPRAHA